LLPPLPTMPDRKSLILEKNPPELPPLEPLPPEITAPLDQPPLPPPDDPPLDDLPLEPPLDEPPLEPLPPEITAPLDDPPLDDPPPLLTAPPDCFPPDGAKFGWGVELPDCPDLLPDENIPLILLRNDAPLFSSCFSICSSNSRFNLVTVIDRFPKLSDASPIDDKREFLSEYDSSLSDVFILATSTNPDDFFSDLPSQSPPELGVSIISSTTRFSLVIVIVKLPKESVASSIEYLNAETLSPPDSVIFSDETADFMTLDILAFVTSATDGDFISGSLDNPDDFLSDSLSNHLSHMESTGQ